MARQGDLCADCFNRIAFISAPFCQRCGVPFASEAQAGAARLCPSCAEAPPIFRQARAALRYDAEARRLILPFKHSDRQELAPILAAMMERAGAGLLREAGLLVPVPLHRRRLFQRRYNQAALLAFAVRRRTGHAVGPDVLLRLRQTDALEEKSPGERAQEVAGAFAVRPGREPLVAGKVVLLIDDVLTSGATANGCAEALLRAGARAVDVLAAARVPDPRLR